MGTPAIPAGAIPVEEFQAHQDAAPTQSSGVPEGAIPEDQFQSSEDVYGTPSQQLKTGIEGAAQGVLGPAAPWLETHVLGVKPENIKGRQEENPITHGVTEAGGFLGGDLLGTGEAALLGHLGEGVADIAKIGSEGSVLEKLSQGASKTAAELGMYQAGDDASNAIVNGAESPGDIISHISASNVLKAAALGGIAGPIFAGAGILGKKALDNTFLKDFADRLSFRKGNIDPTEMMKHEAETAINTYHDMATEIGGVTGIKSQAIEKLLPEEMSPAMDKQIQELSTGANAAIEKLKSMDAPARLTSKLSSDVSSLLESVTAPGASVKDTFDSLNAFKKQLQDYSKGNWGPFAIPSHHEAYDFLQTTKLLSHEVRNALENPKVWGEAATLQKDLNGAWKKAIPAADDFSKKFMVKIGDVPEISTDKFNTYMNQVNKAATATDRQRLLGNFVNSMDEYYSKVNGIYEKAGVENPFSHVSMTALKESLNKPSSGSKLADLWYDRLGASSAGTAVGSGVGASLGHALLGPTGGLGGAYIGKEVLGPVFSSLLKPLMEKYPNMDLHAFRQAASYAHSVMKGDALLRGSVKSIFNTGKTLLTKTVSNDDIRKLDQYAQSLNDKTQQLPNPGSKIGTYLPDHSASLTATISGIVNYINNARPTSDTTYPMQSKTPISSVQQAQFDQKLRIIQQPMSIIGKIKNGTLVPADVETIKTVMPDYYQKMSREIFKGIATANTEKTTIPFAVKQSLSLFLGQPLTPSLTPQSISAAQPMPSSPPQQPQGGKNKKGTSSLGKSNKQYLTPSQSAEAERTEKA